MIAPARVRLAASAMSVMWVAAGALLLTTVVLPHPRAMDSRVIGLIAVVALAVGGGLWLARTWVHPGVLVGLSALAVALVSVLVLVAGSGSAAMAFGLFYGWVVIHAVLFYAQRVVLGVVLLAGVASTAVFLSMGTVSTVEPMMILGTLVVTAGVITVLLRTSEAAYVDALTGLPNRRGLDRILETRMDVARAAGTPLTIAVIDIDHFKEINDDRGHLADDEVLQTVASRWQPLLRPRDTIGRYGGDEFVVVLPDCPAERAEAIVERLRSAPPDGMHCSAGVAGYELGDSMSMLFNRADTALYAAKRFGRGRTVVADGSDGRDEVLAATGELQDAIEADQFVVFYQPVIDLRTGWITAFEALVRWEHPQRGLLPPSEFITLAERTGLIVPLGARVLDLACHEAKRWNKTFPEQPVGVAVNLAVGQLEDDALLDVVAEALARSGLPAELLTLELTETGLLQDPEVSAARLSELRQLGVQLAMDDFGTGYSSLSQLRQLPFDVVKIDRAFVADLPHSPESTALIEAILSIGHSLGRSVTAEGVETIEQLNHLHLNGCDQAQGFLLGRPMPAESLSAALRQQGRVQRLVRVGDPEDPATEPSREVLELLDQFSDDGRPVEEMVRPLLDSLIRASGLESAYFTRIDWERLEQHVLQSVNSGTLAVEEGAVIAWNDTVCRRALQTGTHQTTDLDRDYGPTPAAQGLGIQTYVTSPVVLTDGTVFGTLCTASSEQRQASEHFGALLNMYSRLIADLVEQRRVPQGQ